MYSTHTNHAVTEKSKKVEKWACQLEFDLKDPKTTLLINLRDRAGIHHCLGFIAKQGSTHIDLDPSMHISPK